MNTIRQFAKGSEEYNRLSKMSDILTENSPNGYKYHVGDCYFDMGQGWMWTTIICDKTDGYSYQALSPVEQERIIYARDDEFTSIANDIFSSKYCPDKFTSMDILTEILVG